MLNLDIRLQMIKMHVWARETRTRIFFLSIGHGESGLYINWILAVRLNQMRTANESNAFGTNIYGTGFAVSCGRGGGGVVLRHDSTSPISNVFDSFIFSNQHQFLTRHDSAIPVTTT